MKTWTIKAYRIQVYFPMISHRSTDDRHQFYMLFDTRICATWGIKFWAIGISILGFGAGMDWQHDSLK